MLIDVQPFFTAFFTVADEIEESGIIGVRDRITVHVEGVQIDGMHRTLVGISIHRTHQKRPAGNYRHLRRVSFHRQHNREEK